MQIRLQLIEIKTFARAAVLNRSIQRLVNFIGVGEIEMRRHRLNRVHVTTQSHGTRSGFDAIRVPGVVKYG